MLLRLHPAREIEWSRTSSLCFVVIALLAQIFFTAEGYATPFSDANWVSMGGYPGANGPINAAVVDGSGNLYIGGHFTVVGNVPATNVAKWNGSSWLALGSGIDDEVYALAVSGHELYAGGVFTAGSRTSRISKWNGSWTEVGAMNGNVYALASAGSDLYAGGLFAQAMTTGGVAVTVNSIAKWNGSSWSALGPGVNSDVNALAVASTDVYAVGYFTAAGGSPANHIAKWNGSNWAPLGSGLNIAAWAVAVSGNAVYAGGGFTTAGGSAANYIARWNGASWSALGSGVSGEVWALAASGSDLYAGGLFTSAGGKVSAYLARAYLERPSLSILRAGGEATLSWPTFYEGFVLQQKENATDTNGWVNVNYPLGTNGATKSTTVSIAPTNQFFRLIGE